MLHREITPVKIGMHGINQDIIQAEGTARAVTALKTFKIIIDNLGITKIFAFGTSALRNARNASEVMSTIKEATHFDVTIISGDEEADFIYLGVKSAMKLGEDTSLIIDIGGGSVEFIVGNEHQVLWKQSIEIGAQRLLEKFQKHDPIAENEILELNHYFDESLGDLLAALRNYQPKILIGSSGTFDTLSEIYCIKNNIPTKEEDSETPLTMKGFYSIYQELITKNRAERLVIQGMIEMRVDMIVVACCLIRYILDNHAFKVIRVSTYSLKEGVLASMTPP